ncbi:MAG: hypothetical protein GX190_00355 [Mollicutes bacterium]|nr:hypothetical protein [Mollicutes bacterium]
MYTLIPKLFYTIKHSDSVIIYSPKLQKKLPKNHKLYNRFYKKEYEGLSSKKITEIIMQEKSIEVHEKTKGKTLVKRR